MLRAKNIGLELLYSSIADDLRQNPLPAPEGTFMAEDTLTAQRRERSVRFARDAVQARTDYDADSKAIDELTVRLRRERLEREASEKRAAKKSGKLASAPTKARRSAGKRLAGKAAASGSSGGTKSSDIDIPHRFKLGQSVVIAVKGAGTIGAAGNYRIVKQLPPEGGDNLYRIKGDLEAYERVVAESRLKSAE